MKIDAAALQPFIDERYISVQKHPTEDLYIYNYTPKTQFARLWNEQTMTCRGLIARGDGTIVARPFPKFFNLDEIIARGESLPAEDFEVFDKLDGSLGILYHDSAGHSLIATRGSFLSEQAARGTRLLREKYGDLRFDPACTYLFEVIYPENRIVVDYVGLTDLVLLTVIDTDSGAERPYEWIHAHYGDRLPIAERFDGLTDLEMLRERQPDNKEGFVIRFAGGLRVKLKLAEYVRLHRIVTGVNARMLWEMLRDGQPLAPLLDRVPDEFYAWVSATIRDLQAAYAAREQVAREAYWSVAALPSRKEQAQALATDDARAIVFRMLDGKPYEDVIWKELRPDADRPFKEDDS